MWYQRASITYLPCICDVQSIVHAQFMHLMPQHIREDVYGKMMGYIELDQQHVYCDSMFDIPILNNRNIADWIADDQMFITDDTMPNTLQLEFIYQDSGTGGLHRFAFALFYADKCLRDTVMMYLEKIE